MTEKTAAILAIGDELLSGRTRDANIHYLASWLTERAVALREARIVADDLGAIAAGMNDLRAQHDYVFTSGGIGPTHDDITVDGIAQGFGVDVIEHEEALALLKAWYDARGEELTPARRRMARAPKGATLIRNPVTGAPGLKMDNVFVMAGVPSIFIGMLGAVEADIKGGVRVHSCAVTAEGLPESRLAADIKAIQDSMVGVAMGSYPIDGDIKGVTIVARSVDAALARRAIDKAADAMRALGATPQEGERKGRA